MAKTEAVHWWHRWKNSAALLKTNILHNALVLGFVTSILQENKRNLLIFLGVTSWIMFCQSLNNFKSFPQAICIAVVPNAHALILFVPFGTSLNFVFDILSLWPNKFSPGSVCCCQFFCSLFYRNVCEYMGSLLQKKTKH